MSEDQFLKLFPYIEEFRSEMNEKFENTATKDSLDSLIRTMDSYIARIRDEEAEQVARDAQFNRLVEWARLVSEKTGVPSPDL